MEASPLVRLQNTVIEQFKQTAWQVEGDDKMSHADQNSREVAIDLYKNSGDTLSCALQKAKDVFMANKGDASVTDMEVLFWESGVKSILGKLRHIERKIYIELSQIEAIAARIAAHVQLHDSDMVSSGPFLKQVRVLSQDFLSSEILEVAKGKLEELMAKYQPICTGKERERSIRRLQREFKEYVAKEREALGSRHWYLCEPRLFSKGKADKLRKKVNALYTAAVKKKEAQVVEEKVSIEALNPEMYSALQNKMASLAVSTADDYIQQSISGQCCESPASFGRAALVKGLGNLIKREYKEVVYRHLTGARDHVSLVIGGCLLFEQMVSAQRRHFIESPEHQAATRMKVEGMAKQGLCEKAQNDIRNTIDSLDREYIVNMECDSYTGVNQQILDEIRTKIHLHFASTVTPDIVETKVEECYQKFCESVDANLLQWIRDRRACGELKGADFPEVRVVLGMLAKVQASVDVSGPLVGPLFEEGVMKELRDEINAHYSSVKPDKERLLEFVCDAYCAAFRKKYSKDPPLSWLMSFSMGAVEAYKKAVQKAKELTTGMSLGFTKQYMIDTAIAAVSQIHDKSLCPQWVAEKYYEALGSLKKDIELEGDLPLTLVFTRHFMEDERRKFEASLKALDEETADK